VVSDVLAGEHFERFHLGFSNQIFLVEALHPIGQKAGCRFRGSVGGSGLVSGGVGQSI
jgi:hypothetical protein